MLLEDAPPDPAASGAATFSGGALSARPTEGLAEDEDDVLASGTGAGRGLSRPGSASGLSSAVGSYAALTRGSLACLVLEEVVAAFALVPNLHSTSYVCSSCHLFNLRLHEGQLYSLETTPGYIHPIGSLVCLESSCARCALQAPQVITPGVGL